MTEEEHVLVRVTASTAYQGEVLKVGWVYWVPKDDPDVEVRLANQIFVREVELEAEADALYGDAEVEVEASPDPPPEPEAEVEASPNGVEPSPPEAEVEVEVGEAQKMADLLGSWRHDDDGG